MFTFSSSIFCYFRNFVQIARDDSETKQAVIVIEERCKIGSFIPLDFVFFVLVGSKFCYIMQDEKKQLLRNILGGLGCLAYALCTTYKGCYRKCDYFGVFLVI